MKIKFSPRMRLAAWVVLMIVITGGWLYASGTYRYPIPRGAGVTIGDILYVNRNDQMTNLNAGSNGTVLQGAGAATAPAYVAKQVYRRATIHNLATAAVSWTLSADEILCMYLAATNANGAWTIQLPATDGATYIFRNGSGQTATLHTGASTGVGVTSGYTAQVYYDSTLADYFLAGTMFKPF